MQLITKPLLLLLRERFEGLDWVFDCCSSCDLALVRRQEGGELAVVTRACRVETSGISCYCYSAGQVVY